MNFSFFVLSILSLFNYYVKTEVKVHPEHHFFTQRLDHADPSNNRTWQQKFYIVGEYATNENAPNILGLIDAIKVEAHDAYEGLWNLQAKELKTNLFVTDLRFYGFTWPTEDLSDENLKYFTTQQMLGDIEYFMFGMNQFLAERNTMRNQSQKWIVQGCGFAGTLATLARAKNPGFVVGAVAVRASPLQPSIEAPGIFENVIQSFREESPRCVENIREGFKQMDAIIKSTSGAKTLGYSFQLCSSIEDQTVLMDNDAFTLTFLIAHLLANSVQERTEVQNLSSVRDVCRIINDESRGSAFQRVAQAHDLLRQEAQQYCTPLYKDYVNMMKDVSYNAQWRAFFPQLRQWKYLQCFEGGTFTTSRNVQETFYGDRFNLTFLLKVCEDAFPTWTLATLEKNIALNKAMLDMVLPNLTNVAFTHERSDPYRIVNYYTRNPESTNIEMTGTGNCAILNKANLFDPIDVKYARRKLNSLLVKWSEEA